MDLQTTETGNAVYIEEIKIPHDRVAVLIGKNGQTKRKIEKLIKCTLDIDSKEGEVRLTSKESMNLLDAKAIIKAIARGFNPDIAKLIAKEEYAFELIDLRDYNTHKNHQERLKGRVIGRDGKSRSLIEEYTDCNVSVYGKTIGIIGKIENVQIAHKAIDSLLGGSPHAFVYKWLEKQRSLQLSDKISQPPL